MNHIVIIRFHYEENDPRWPWRFQYFKEQVLPRLLNQTNQDFDIGIRCNRWQIPFFMELSDKIIPFYVKNEKAQYRPIGGKMYFFDFAKWEDVVGLKQYDIQSGLDSDDLVSPNYIQKTKDSISEFALKHPGKSFHLSFQPEIHNVKTYETYPIGVKYSPRVGSAFFAIYQPKKEKYIFAYQYSHMKLGQVMDFSITLPAGSCWASVHELNESTGKKR